jgi:hypothetical protein
MGIFPIKCAMYDRNGHKPQLVGICLFEMGIQVLKMGIQVLEMGICSEFCV